MRCRKSLLITVFLAVCAIVSVFAGGVERSRLTGSSQPMCLRHAFCGSISADTLSQVFSIADSLSPGDVAPSFPGGIEALERYIKDNLIYPTIARENGIEGSVSVAFTVMPDGNLSDIRVVKAVDPSLDREAARLVKSMPFWTPGRRHALGDKPAAMRCIIVLSFRLADLPARSRYSLYAPVPMDTPSDVFSIMDSLSPGDVAPSFPGGVEALERYIKDNLVYPTLARENGIEGSVPVAFTVMPDGNLSDIRVVKAVDPSLDRESARIVYSMPRWTPGRRHALGNKPAAIRCIVVITFRLAD